MLKQVVIVADDASQLARLLDAIDTAIKCSLNPKDIADFKHIRTMVATQNVSFEQGYEGVLSGITRLTVNSAIKNLKSYG